jgi:probable phosphoglycerate mutase
VLSRVDVALLDGDVVLVAHGHFLRVVTARRLGLAPAEGRLFQLATGTVSRLSTEHGRPVISVGAPPTPFRQCGRNARP